MDDVCNQCGLPFENSSAFLELIIETALYTHHQEFCSLRCVHTWVGNQMRDDEE